MFTSDQERLLFVVIVEKERKLNSEEKLRIMPRFAGFHPNAAVPLECAE